MTRADARVCVARARQICEVCSLAPALADAGAAARLEVENVHEPRASLSATPTMLIEIIFVFVTVTEITRAICLALRGFIADEGYELFELTLVQPDAA